MNRNTRKDRANPYRLVLGLSQALANEWEYKYHGDNRYYLVLGRSRALTRLSVHRRSAPSAGLIAYLFSGCKVQGKACLLRA